MRRRAGRLVDEGKRCGRNDPIGTEFNYFCSAAVAAGTYQTLVPWWQTQDKVWWFIPQQPFSSDVCGCRKKLQDCACMTAGSPEKKRKNTAFPLQVYWCWVRQCKKINANGNGCIAFLQEQTGLRISNWRYIYHFYLNYFKVVDKDCIMYVQSIQVNSFITHVCQKMAKH